MGTLTRTEYLALPWSEQKTADLRKVLDPESDVDLTANCIMDKHQDDSASMVIYSNGVWCFGCKSRLWPDQFLRMLGDLPLSTERGSRKLPAPKFIPLAQVKTYAEWLQLTHYTNRLPWLLQRGLSLETLRNNLIGHTGEAFTIPILDYGLVRSVRYRRDDELASEDRPKYWGTPGANDAMLYTPVVLGPKFIHEYGLILCEGELDALRLAQEGYPAVSLTNGCNALKAEHVAQLKATARTFGLNKVTICYDQDEPGRAGAESAYILLAYHQLESRIVHWPGEQGKDVTEYLKSTGTGQLVKRLEFMWHR